MINESGNLSVNTEDIFPIIKKWLYSDKDIFLREMVSNACDAIAKFKRLVSLGEADADPDEQYKIRVVLDKKNKTIKIMDNGIGMTADEVKKYINQVAFSGAKEFLEKYKDQNEASQIIGHFGLGFYSAFMVSDKVEIDTLSWQEGAEPVKWISDGGTTYEMTSSEQDTRGTVVTLHIAEDSKEFLDKHELRRILEKYCAFLPVEIYLEDAEDKKKDKEEAKPVNDTNPLWLKSPSECTEEEYREFYRKVFMDFQDPLFWIHLNVDYPFNLKGILYFPKLRNEFETMEGQIKLYNNQVFVADNIKEVIPEWLLLLKGVIDCPDLPLNVSRSFLQNDGSVRKISDHISKKVADKLNSMYKTERDNYEKYWDDINPFIKFGCMKDDKFYKRVKDILIFKSTSGDYTLLKDYLDRNRDKHKNQVYYISDEKQQAQYIRIFKENDLEALYLDSIIDSHFINFLEMKESDTKFLSVDSDISEGLKDKDGAGKDDKKLEKTLENLFKECLNRKDLKIQVEALKTPDIPAVILQSEQSKRLQEMTRYFGSPTVNNFPSEQTLVLNRKNGLISRLAILKDNKERKQDVDLICKHVYDLAMMNHKPLEPEEMAEFVKRSNKLLSRLTELKS
ncbi:MAG: molecular chaperone HtpG [Clostridiales bacterium]|nr:molecular chaperone HtpG [Clostridiales bacterium]